jgi:transketolase
MTKTKIETLQSTALRVREHIIRMSGGGGCFIGASLSCVEIMVYCYSGFLKRGGHPNDPDRDYCFLSKGHDVPALYGTFVEMGMLGGHRLRNHLSTSDSIYWHPNTAIPGVEFHSGSLGHLPAVAAGVALDCKLKGGTNKVIVITGDGELNEGSVWEALLVANAYGLDNLTLLVDRNQFQANIRTEELIPLEPLADKFRAFGCRVQRIDGHDFTKLEEAFGALAEEEAGEEHDQANGADMNGKRTRRGKVNVIIADTVRGKGLPSIEARADRWFCAFSEDEVEYLLQELHGNAVATISSEALLVR